MSSSAPPRARTKRAATAAVATGALMTVSGLAVLAGPVGASASSHREAPNIAGLPQYDTTDVYAFTSPDKPDTVTMIANWLPFSDPAGGPNFYAFADDARYDINIDNDGDGETDILYRYVFKSSYRNGNTFLYNTGPVTSLDDPDLNFQQTYSLRRWVDGKGWSTLTTKGKVAPSNVGKASIPDYSVLRDQAIGKFGKVTSYAGQADDPFFLDLRVFDLLYGGDLSEVGDDTLAGYNVNSVALQVPKSDLKGKNDSVIGVWSTTSKKDSNGSYKQVSRLGMPLVNEVVIPVKDKDRFNASKPENDLANFGSYILSPELPKLIEAVYGIPAPAEPRNDLVAVFATGVAGLNQPAKVTPAEMIRLNLDTPVAANPNPLGVIGGDVAGYPNGRRLADDTIDISLQVVEGELVGAPNDLGDGVSVNDAAFGTSFPYLALPWSGSLPDPVQQSSGLTALTGGLSHNDTGMPVSAGAMVALLGVGAMGVGMVALRRGRSAAVTA